MSFKLLEEIRLAYGVNGCWLAGGIVLKRNLSLANKYLSSRSPMQGMISPRRQHLKTYGSLGDQD